MKNNERNSQTEKIEGTKKRESVVSSDVFISL